MPFTLRQAQGERKKRRYIWVNSCQSLILNQVKRSFTHSRFAPNAVETLIMPRKAFSATTASPPSSYARPVMKTSSLKVTGQPMAVESKSKANGSMPLNPLSLDGR